MRTLVLGLRRYHAQHGHFPPPYVADSDGTPMHSWRVLILPYVDERPLYDRYDFDEPWDGPNNRTLLDERPECFSCPSHGHHGEHLGVHLTNYVLLTPVSSAFATDSPVSITTLADGPANTIVATEVNKRSVPWTAPIDLPIEDFVGVFGEGGKSAANETNHDGSMVVVGFADGHAQALSLSSDQAIVQALTTASGAEALNTLRE